MKGAMAGTLAKGRMTRTGHTGRRGSSLENVVKTVAVTAEEESMLKSFWSGVRYIATLQKNPMVKNSKAKSNFSRATIGKTASEARVIEKQTSFAIHSRELKLQEQNRWIPLFSPDTQRKLLWDSFIGILIFYSVTIIPFRIGFQRDSSPTAVLFDFGVDIFFFTDICVVFNTTFIEPTTELIVTDRWLIALNYLKLWFWIDLFSTVPVDRLVGIFMGGGDDLAALGLIRILRLTRLLKLLRVLKLSKIGKFFEEFNINPALMGVQKLVVQICFVAHIISCFWYFLSTPDVVGFDDDYATGVYVEDTWAKKFNFVDVPILEKYVASFYWTISTMLSIGYGDIHATNSGERIYSIVTQLLGAVMFGAVIAQVTRLIESQHPQQRAFKEKMDELKAYLNEKLLPNKTKRLAKNSYGYFLQKKSAFAESSIFQDLPPNLLNKLVMNIYSEEISRINLFRLVTDDNFVVRIVTNGKPFQAGPGTLIMEKGDVPDEISFVMRGLVQFSTTDGVIEAISGYSTEGGYFGEFEYYKKTLRLVSHQAMVNCNLFSVPTSVFDDIIGQFPSIGEKIVAEFESRYEGFLEVSKCQNIQRENELKTGKVAMQWYKTALLVDGAVQGCTEDEMGSRSLKRNSVFTAKITKGKSTVVQHVEMYRTTKLVRARYGDGWEEEIVEESEDDIIKRYLILPKSDNKVKWDIYVGVLIVYSVLIIPVQIGFGREAEGGLKIFDYCVDGFFFVDMVLSARTCYYDDDSESYVTIPKRIYYNYLVTWFAVDFFSVLPLDLMFRNAGSSMDRIFRSLKLIKVIRLLRLLKLARLAKLRKYLTRIEDALGINPATFELAKMILEVIFIGHLTACIYWYLSAVMTTRAWFDLLDLRDATLGQQYIATIYWTFTTLATVGYGDITPTNTSGRVVTVVVMILGATVFGYIVANVSTLMGSLDVTSTRMNERIAEVTEYLNEKNAPSHLSDAIVKHVKYMFTQASAFDERGILSRLPNYIVRRMILYQHSETLSKIAIFKYIESKGVILYLFRKLQPVFYDVDHFIVYEHAMAKDISFLVSGKCEVYRSKIKNLSRDTRRGRQRGQSKTLKAIPLALCDKVATLEPGDMFGHLSLMKKTPLTGSVRTFLPSSVYNLSESEITKLISEFPQVAISLQNALGCSINNRRKMGKAEYRQQRAAFIAELRKTFLEKRAQKLGAANLAKKKARKKRISSMLSRGISLGSVQEELGHIPIRRTLTPLEVKVPKTSGKYFVSTKIAPSIGENESGKIAKKEDNEKIIASRQGLSALADISSINRGVSEEEKSGTSTPVKPFLDEDSDGPRRMGRSESLGDESPGKGRRSTKMTRAQKRWKMISAVIRDPVLMAIIAQTPLESEQVKQIEHDSAPSFMEKAKNVVTGGAKIAGELQKESSIPPRPTLGKPSSFGQVALQGLKKVKVDRINLIGPENENYDSEDELLMSEEHALKRKALMKNSIECPDFSNRAVFNRRRKLRRRSSFPSYDLKDWKEQKQYTLHL